jgi:hypothetical protein
MTEDIHWQKYASRFKTYPALLNPLDTFASVAVCIPVFAEPDLILTLESLWRCDRLPVEVDIILLFNGKEQMNADERDIHNYTWKDCLSWIEGHSDPYFRIRPISLEEMPGGLGGVGLARKLVLDEAARWLPQYGILICLDADCTIEKKYLTSIYTYFQNNSLCQAVSIYFEHQLEGLNIAVRDAIVQYELHLRYLVHVLRWVGHPFAFQTVGSSMAVRRSAYLLQGGMNSRQAGEDFYFLQKFIEVDALHEMKDTVVYPSSRISGRVPFGTGKAMQQLLSGSSAWQTTDIEVYHQIIPLFQGLDKLRTFCIKPITNEIYPILQQELKLSDPLINYLQSIDFYTECLKLSKQTSSPATFTRRFFRYFNAFRMIRYAHYMRDHFYPDVSILVAIERLCAAMNITPPSSRDAESYLVIFRKLDRT